MVITETSKVWRFLSGLHLGLARLVDTRRDSPESYADAVGHAICQESWMKTENRVSLSAGEGLKDTTQPHQSQVYGKQRGGERSWFQSRKPNNQDKSSGSGGKH